MILIFCRDAICMLKKVACEHCQVVCCAHVWRECGLHVREYRPHYAMKQQRVLAGVRFALFVGGG